MDQQLIFGDNNSHSTKLQEQIRALEAERGQLIVKQRKVDTQLILARKQFWELQHAIKMENYEAES